MKTLVVVGHSDLSKSRVNNAFVQELQKDPAFTLNVLSEKYKNNIGNINVEEEQKLLLEHDRIVLQFPLYWYSTPALLKSWIDQVLTFGFAYGPEGDKLKGKEFILAVSTGAPAQNYQKEGAVGVTIGEILSPVVSSFQHCQSTVLETFLTQGTHTMDENAIKISAENYIKHIQQ